jgi:hypothetical protein
MHDAALGEQCSEGNSAVTIEFEWYNIVAVPLRISILVCVTTSSEQQYLYLG